MAYTKDSTTKSATSKTVTRVKKIEPTKVEKEVKVETTTVHEEKKAIRKFEPDDMIACMCVKPNPVIFYSAKTDTRYEFGGYGDINEIYYADLLRFRSSRAAVLFEPKIIILDEDLREQWARDLKKVSDEYLDMEDIMDIFNQDPSDFELYLSKASKNIKELVKTATSKLIREEQLTDLRLIRIIDDILGTQFKEFI